MAITGTLGILAAIQNALDVPPAANNNRSGAITDYISQTYAFADGVGAGQNDIVWSDRITLAGGATTVLTLSAGLLDVYGNVTNFVRVTGIALRNRETVAGTRILNFGPNAGRPYLWLFLAAANRAVIPPGGCYMQWDDNGTGVAIAPGANDRLDITNTDGVNAVTYDIVVVGRTV
jgi:hypothetical protein